MKNLSLNWTGRFVAVVLFALVLWPHSARAITGGELDGEGHANVGTFVNPDGIDYDFDGVPDYDVDQDGIPDVPVIGGNLTLIHPRVAIGAAHVFEVVQEELAAGYYTWDDIFVSFSPDPANHPESYRAMSQIIIHPDYDTRLLPGCGALPRIDVAVVILREPVIEITPAALAPEGLLDELEAAGVLLDKEQGAPFTVVGYGYTGKAPNQLVPPDGQRRAAISEFMHLDDQWMFLDQNAAHDNGGSQIWDSGGPTFWVDPDTGEETLVALVSNGDASGVATGLNFRTDIPETLEFIIDVFARVEAGEL